ncbi:MAG: UDP-N-acetylmuramate dehydrogenase [Patescibacteria group bacterium]
MQIVENFNLKNLNTFGVEAQARFFAEIKSKEDLLKLISLDEFKNNKRLFLGGGSNVLFTEDFNGIVVSNRIKGIETIEEDEDSILLKVFGGENWHEFVLFTVDKGYWGIENLALIPGTVGAAPVQNIGAYGVELKDSLEEVEVLNISSGVSETLIKAECGFGYRDSIFKHEMKDDYFIVSITIRLSKKEKKNISYKVLKEYLEQNNLVSDTPRVVSDAVVTIRQSKLPDPKILGNAGSFFKNTFVNKEKFGSLIKEFPEMPYFEEGGYIKIPSGWLIEKVGLKGLRMGDVGIYEKQSLVIVNYGNSTGEQIKNFSVYIIDEVYKKFGIILLPEVNFF